MTSSDAPPIRCFLSYAQQDDVVMDFVGPFTKSLSQYAYADRGRELEIFVDRQELGWGDLAQPAIRAAVRSATVFLPVITRRYFDRPYCREELFIFYNQACVDGVPSLLLPVVLLGESYLTENSSDLAVQLIAERQQRRLREAWIEGPASPAWRRTLLALAGELVEQVEEAERQLTGGTPAFVLDETQAIEDIEQFGYDARHVVDVTTEVVLGFQDVLSKPDDEEAKAEALLPGAVRLRDAARYFEGRVFAVDRLVRARSYRVGPRASELFSLADGIEQLLASTQRDELTNVPMRRSMIPFRQGLTILRSAVNMASHWADLPNRGQ